MAAIAIMRTYFRVVINVSSEMARTIIDQGLDDFNSLVEFTEAGMKTLCTTIPFPGRMIINPRANIADQHPTILDPGHLISMVAKKGLLITAYVAIHQARTSRPIDSQSTTRAFVMSLVPLRGKDLDYSKLRAIDKPLEEETFYEMLFL